MLLAFRIGRKGFVKDEIAQVLWALAGSTVQGSGSLGGDAYVICH